MTHPVWGIPIFLGIMACVFFLTFTVGDLLKGGISRLGLDCAFRMLVPVSDFQCACGRMAEFSDCGRHHCRRGRDSDLSAEYFYPFPGAGVSGGQRLYGPSGLCDGRASWERWGFPARHSCPCCWGLAVRFRPSWQPGRWRREKDRLKDDADDAVYVLLGQTADLCLVFGDVFLRNMPCWWRIPCM